MRSRFQANPKNRKIKAYRAGLVGELAALLLLFFKGYRIVGWRYKTRVGEIDILAFKGDTLAAVEVKARASAEAAIESVNANNRSRVEKAALHYMSGRRGAENWTLRFDVMAVKLAGGILPVSCKHLDNAWQSRSY
ncbi:MAG: YraN family protein [Alphaproteobacteria bacterium]|nr:YraN family protein [Alphaproteobacteria bacterium]MCD8571670.1 YraN family protein [Alphaproteobacteria bacterium]